MRSAEQLIVDRRVHAAEIARFHSHVVCGPTASDCNIWAGAIGADGYGRFYLTREGGVVFARTATRWRSCPVGGRWGARATRVRQPGVRQGRVGDRSPPARRFGLAGRQHGSHGAGCAIGGGRYAVRRFDSRGLRRERSVALREAVRHGWDDAAVQAALLGDQPTLW